MVAERLTRRDALRAALPIGGAIALSGCVAVFSRQEEEVSQVSSPVPSETPRPSLTPEACQKHPLVELFERLGLDYDGTYFYDQEGNKFVFEGFERQEKVEGTCPERIIIELKGEPCETATPTKTATRRVVNTPTRERRDTPKPPTDTPVPPTTEVTPTPTAVIPTPAPTNIDEDIPTATSQPQP